MQILLINSKGNYTILRLSLTCNVSVIVTSIHTEGFSTKLLIKRKKVNKICWFDVIYFGNNIEKN